MKLKIVTLILILFCPLFAVADNETPLTDEEKYIEWAKGIWDSIDRQTGDIVLPDAGAKLHVPEDFYYLSPKDSERILVEVWCNPPGQDTLGMLFPAESTPFDQDSWAVTISYEEDGYVSDEDADKIDYSELLKEMQSSSSAQNKERVKQGYDPVVLLGWAAQPYYDKESHKLHWAKELKFGNQETNTLNYNIRVLGRKGVLVLNFIAGMDQKELIETKLDTVLSLADFDQGSTYKDFDPQIDKVAAYGIGALVAGKVLAKTGFFAIALIFMKKFGVFIVVGLGAFVKGLFKRKDA